MSVRRHLLLEILVAIALSWTASASVINWIERPVELQPSGSVRIRADLSQSTIAWGMGSASDPVGLRSLEYQFQSKKPYEWLLKFNLNSYKGKHIKNAVLRVSKCSASKSCASECKQSGKCTCPIIQNIVESSCGGGHIDETYSTSSDDLHAWYISNNWDARWAAEDWVQTFNGGSRAGVESCCSQGTGGSNKLSFSKYLAGVATVGETGTASLNIVEALGDPDPAVEGKHYLVRGGYVSIRLTVNGTNSRFFVPEGGDAAFAPLLRLGYEFTTTPTTSTSPGQSQQSTTSKATTSQGATAAGTTTQPGTTTTTAASSTTAGPTAAGTTNQPGTTTTTAASSTTTTPGSTTAATTSTISKAASKWDLNIKQGFAVQFSETADMSAAVNRSSFKENCRKAQAYALAKDVLDVRVLSAEHISGRRLAAISSENAKVVVEFNVHAKTLAEVNQSVASTQTMQFGQVFSKQLIAAEQQLGDGLRISWYSHLETSISSSVSRAALQASPNRTALGGVLNIYGSRSWGSARLSAWAVSATPSIRVAVIKSLASLVPSIPEEELVVGVVSGPLTVTASNAKLQFDIFLQVPPLKNPASDPTGRLYRERANAFAVHIVKLASSSDFEALLMEEFARQKVPALPSMSLSPGEYDTATGDYGGAAASGEVIAAILGGFVLLAAVCFSIVQYRKSPRLRKKVQRCCCCCCPRCCRPSSGMVSPAHSLSSSSALKDAERGQAGSIGSSQSTATTFGTALQEFEIPMSPSEFGSNFLAMLSSQTPLSKPGDKSFASKESTNHSQSIPATPGNKAKKKRKFLGETGHEKRKPLHKEANSLRLAMGGAAFHRKPRHEMHGKKIPLHNLNPAVSLMLQESRAVSDRLADPDEEDSMPMQPTVTENTRRLSTDLSLPHRTFLSAEGLAKHYPVGHHSHDDDTSSSSSGGMELKEVTGDTSSSSGDEG